MKKMQMFAVLVVATVALAACGGSGGGTTTGTAMAGKATCAAQAGVGVLCGTAVAADGVTPLAGAEVQLSSSSAMTVGKLATLGTKGVEDSTRCVADATGNFACVVPSGSVGTLNFILIFTGFENKSFSATITADATTDVGAQTMAGSSSEKWVVVPGEYDGVQVLLAQLKGCTLDDGSGGAFDPATMDAAGARASTDCTNKGLLVLDETLGTETSVATFLASSTLSEYDALFINCAANYSSTEVDTRIREFSTAGGHVYFSDLADSWLTSLFPGYVTFFGTPPYPSNTGTISAEVVYAGLATVVGNPIDIVFDLPVWAPIDSVTSSVTTYIQGDLSTLVTGLAGTHPLTVGWRSAASSGCIFYTSYHIEGASTGAAQELAIKYLVQNIATVCPAS